ncbi:anthranilate phosphoribosyltransferase [Deltaproteobacteria bacterium Smac51]|nr:anthranilate phosphoribosyltransferase [Deltaproteobacteria bacterium Smac51]
MFLLIDNYDSFTYNLVQAFQVLGHAPLVLKNDDPGLLKLAADPNLRRVCLSPGPGNPGGAGQCLEFLKILDEKNPEVPVLGVCLGHQILGQFGGGEVFVSDLTMHGKTSTIRHDGKGLFKGLPDDFVAGRYHSLLVRENPAARFTVNARTIGDEVMGLAYKDRPWAGVQFHPESVLTPKGPELLANFFQADQIDDAVETASFKEPPFPLPVIMETIASGQDLTREMAAQLFGRLMDGELSPAQAGALLMGLRAKGETPVEMAEAATAILERAIAPPPLNEAVLDIVGTGGDGRSSFNCSTGTALVMAGLGHKVVKHGNRSISSRCGSADVLELLGVDLNAPPADVPRQLRDKNFAFLFAPNYHPSFRHVMPVRKELGVRSLFNILGPLVNPAKPAHSFLGAPNPATLPLLAGALARLGTTFSAIVHGAGGYDEMTTLGPARVFLVEGDKVIETAIDPAAYGFAPCDQSELAISGPDEGVAVLRELLAGRGPKAMRDMLALNVAMALYVKTGAEDFGRCVKEARQAVADGVGGTVL